MEREIIRVEPFSTNFEKWGAPVSVCTRAGNMVFMSGMPPFDPDTGELLGTLTDEDGDVITIPDLWTLLVGNDGAGGDSDDIYFTAGIGDEAHGLLGEIGAVPLPAALPLLLGALGGLLGFGRRRDRSPV